MSVSLIVAMDRNGLIGRDGGLPWRLPNDMKHFRATTMGKAVLMGRKTWDSLGKPLEGRDNWVLTRDPNFIAEGAKVFTDFRDALRAHVEGELMVIGGAQLYRQALPHVDRIYLTRVDTEAQGDTYFPEFHEGSWREVSREDHAPDERHAHPYSFITLERG